MTLLAFEEALATICRHGEPLAPETVALTGAANRTLAETFTATLDQPPFAASAMDGYAARSSDLQTLPAKLNVVGEAAAGHPYDHPLGKGEAVRIFTGGVVPQGADCIPIQEDTRRDGEKVIVQHCAPAGQHIRPAGGDFKSGDPLVAGGHGLGARELMLIAANGVADISVRRRPRIAILATGDEIIQPGAIRGNGQIFSSVPAGLAALAARFGGEPVLLGIASDTRAALEDAIRRGLDCDVLVTIGGASVGDHDFVHAALGASGVDVAFWKIAMRPGKPLMYGRKGSTHTLGLPGNPVSALICARLFLVPLIRALLGQAEPANLALIQMPLGAPIAANGPRKHFMRARTQGGTAIALDNQDSSLMRLFAQADALIVRDPHAPAVEPGILVDVLPFDY